MKRGFFLLFIAFLLFSNYAFTGSGDSYTIITGSKNTEGEYSTSTDFENIPSYYELPNNTGKSQGIDMTGNVLLLHMNDSNATHTAVIIDSSGQDNNGILYTGDGTTSKSISGKFGNAIIFDGTNDYVDLEDINITKTPPFSVSFWFNKYNTSSVGLINKYLSGSWNGFNIFTSSNTLCSWFLRNTANYTAIAQDGGVGSVPCYTYDTNTWYHVIVIISDNGMDMYINGNIWKHSNWTGTAGTTTETNHLILGKYTSYYFGKMDELAIWNRVLSESEINEIYERGVFRIRQTTPEISYGQNMDESQQYKVFLGNIYSLRQDNLRLMDANIIETKGIGNYLYLPLNDKNATNTAQILDSSIYGNHATLYTSEGQTTKSTTGKYNKAINLDGTNDYLKAPIGTWLGQNNHSWSVSAWFNSPSSGGPIIGIIGGGWNMPFLSLSSAGILYGWVYGCPTGIGYSVSKSISFDTWVYGTVTYSSTNGAKLYVNGVLADSNSTCTTYTASGTFDYYTTYISGYKPPSVPSYFKGKLDEVTVWDRELSSNEILGFYQKGVNSETSSKLITIEIYNSSTMDYNKNLLIYDLNSGTVLYDNNFFTEKAKTSIFKLDFNASPGPHTIRLAIDSDNILKEDYENDNNFELSYSVSAWSYIRGDFNAGVVLSKDTGDYLQQWDVNYIFNMIAMDNDASLNISNLTPITNLDWVDVNLGMTDWGDNISATYDTDNDGIADLNRTYVLANQSITNVPYITHTYNPYDYNIGLIKNDENTIMIVGEIKAENKEYSMQIPSLIREQYSSGKAVAFYMVLP